MRLYITINIWDVWVKELRARGGGGGGGGGRGRSIVEWNYKGWFGRLWERGWGTKVYIIGSRLSDPLN